MSDVPEWEIHFLFEKIPKSSAPDMSVEEVSSFIARYGVDIEQTIEYRSAAMIGAARSDYRLIATSYFPDSTKTLKEAEHLFYDTKLCDDAYESGYTVRLILEHIVSCLQPNCDRN
jgi:CRISPR/Cas system CMR-associated protein Cmr1 (group 7 of RAMP superfamily)